MYMLFAGYDKPDLRREQGPEDGEDQLHCRLLQVSHVASAAPCQ